MGTVGLTSMPEEVIPDTALAGLVTMVGVSMSGGPSSAGPIMGGVATAGVAPGSRADSLAGAVAVAGVEAAARVAATVPGVRPRCQQQLQRSAPLEAVVVRRSE